MFQKTGFLTTYIGRGIIGYGSEPASADAGSDGYPSGYSAGSYITNFISDPCAQWTGMDIQIPSGFDCKTQEGMSGTLILCALFLLPGGHLEMRLVTI